MALKDKINEDIKEAMKARDKEKLEALRAIKAAILLVETEKGSEGEMSEDAGIAALQKLVKQRRDAAQIYRDQNRLDLAEPEEFQAAIISQYLPAQLSEDEVKVVLNELKDKLKITGPSDMGKFMGAAMKELQGKADGKLISSLAKEMLR